MSDRLYKKDTKIIIFEEDPEYDCLVLMITSKNGGNYYGSWKDFQPELEEIGIREIEDEWQYFGNLKRLELKKLLQKRNFYVKFSEETEY